MSRHTELKGLLLGLRLVLCSLFWNRTANTFCCRISAFTICWTYHSLSPKPCLFNENRDGRTNSISQNTAETIIKKKMSTYFPIRGLGRGMTQKGKSHFYLSRSEKMLSLSETSESGSRMCGLPLHQWESSLRAAGTVSHMTQTSRNQKHVLGTLACPRHPCCVHSRVLNWRPTRQKKSLYNICF